MSCQIVWDTKMHHHLKYQINWSWFDRVMALNKIQMGFSMLKENINCVRNLDPIWIKLCQMIDMATRQLCVEQRLNSWRIVGAMIFWKLPNDERWGFLDFRDFIVTSSMNRFSPKGDVFYCGPISIHRKKMGTIGAKLKALEREQTNKQTDRQTNITTNILSKTIVFESNEITLKCEHFRKLQQLLFRITEGHQQYHQIKAYTRLPIRILYTGSSYLHSEDSYYASKSKRSRLDPSGSLSKKPYTTSY